MPNTRVVVKAAIGVASFDGVQGYGGDDARVRFSIGELMIGQNTPCVVMEVMDGEHRTRELKVRLDRCDCIDWDTGMLYNDDYEPAAGVKAYYVDVLGFELPPPSYQGETSGQTAGRRVWLNPSPHKLPKNYRYIDLRLSGVSGAEWHGDADCQDIMESFKQSQDLDCLIVVDAAHGSFKGLKRYLNHCRALEKKRADEIALEKKRADEIALPPQFAANIGESLRLLEEMKDDEPKGFADEAMVRASEAVLAAVRDLERQCADSRETWAPPS